MSVDVLLKNVHYAGKCKFVLEMDKMKPFPCISRLFITLMERPKVSIQPSKDSSLHPTLDPL